MENSPLRRLPPELRLDIYEYCLALEGPVEIWYHGGSALQKQPPRVNMCFHAYRSPVRLLAITAVCREIKRETHLVVFRYNDFLIVDFQAPFNNEEAPLRTLIASLGKSAVKMMRQVTVTNKFLAVPAKLFEQEFGNWEINRLRHIKETASLRMGRSTVLELYEPHYSTEHGEFLEIPLKLDLARPGDPFVEAKTAWEADVSKWERKSGTELSVADKERISREVDETLDGWERSFFKAGLDAEGAGSTSTA